MNIEKYGVTVRMLDSDGNPGAKFAEYRKDGRTFIEGRRGTQFCLEIDNNSGDRVLACPFLDNISVIDGKRGSDDSSGYIIEPWSSIKVKGYRKDDNYVGAFKFKEKGKGYATSKGEGENAGIITVNIYKEKTREKIVVEKIVHHDHYHPYPVYPQKPWWDRSPWDPWYPHLWCTTGVNDAQIKGEFTSDPIGAKTDGVNQSIGENNDVSSYNCSCNNTMGFMDMEMDRSGPSAAKGRGMSKKASNGHGQVISANLSHQQPKADWNLEAGWGDKVTDHVREVEFERGVLMATFDIYYSDIDGLKKMEVPLKREKEISYPKTSAPSKYCEPPKDWNYR